jgi:UDP-3-O-[3-hydroxymyristoyl] glucosamine N-acyltransferase
MVAPGSGGDPPIDRDAAREGLALADIAVRLGGEALGDVSVRIVGVASLGNATADRIAYLADPRYRGELATTRAGALVLGPADRDASPLPRIVAAKPQLYFVSLTRLLHPERRPTPGVHPAAYVAPGALVPASVSVGPHAFVGAGAVLGEACVLGPGAHVGERCSIGAATVLHANATVYHDCHIGARVILHSGAVVGADGFGLAHEGDRWTKVPQIGRVLIGDDVEVGANTTIDRGALDDTVIEEGVKLDNQIQIGHNCRIGAHTAIAGCVGIAGSARIGRHCMIGGGSGIHGHIEICDGCIISAWTLITKSITRPGTYTSATPFMEHRAWIRNAARMRSLDELAGRVRALERARANEDKEGESP